MSFKRLAAIDIGSGSIGLLIADVNTNIDSILWENQVRESFVTKLGQGLNQNNLSIQESSIKSTVNALEEIHNIITKNNATLVRIVGTQAMRIANNSYLISDYIKKIFNQDVEIISGEEEANLTKKAVEFSYSFLNSNKDIAIFDIGGSSVEFIYKNNCKSLPIGSNVLAQTYSLNPNKVEIENLSNMMGMLLSDFQELQNKYISNRESLELICVGGGPTTLAMMDEKLKEYSTQKLHNYIMKKEDIEEWFRILSFETTTERANHTGCDEKRASMILGSTAILAGILRAFNLKEIKLFQTNILDGTLINYKN